MRKFLRKIFSVRLGYEGSAASTPDTRNASPAHAEETTAEIHRPSSRSLDEHRG